MPMSQRLLRPKSGFTNPRSLAGLALWLDGADQSTLWSNIGATNPASSESANVLRWNDKSGNGISAQSSRVVSALTITNGGTGYTTAPTVTITRAGADTTGAGATATATIAGGVVTGLTITNRGSLYQTNPDVTFSGGGGTGAAATATVASPATRALAPPGVRINNGGASNTGPYLDLVPEITIPQSHTVFAVINRQAGQNSLSLGSGFDTPTITTHQGSRYAALWFSDNTLYNQANAAFSTHGTNLSTGLQVVSVVHVAGSSSSVQVNRLPASTVTTGVGVTQSATGTWGAIGADVASNALGEQGFQTLRPHRGILHEIIAYNRQLSNAEVLAVIRYLMSKWQIALPPQVSNLGAQDWIDRVYANGGTVSQATADAVNTFCNAIDAAGIRNRFYRLNLFAGTGLSAALVPLYRGPTRTGTQFGNTTDANSNFVSGDYTETGASGGLKGNGSNKSLNTGFLQTNLPSLLDSHLSFSAVELESSYAVERTMIGSSGGTGDSFWVIRQGITAGSREAFAANLTAASAAAATAEPHCLSSRSSSTLLTLYRAGSSVATSTVTATATPAAFAVQVFAQNTNGAISRETAMRCRMYSIGTAIDGSAATAFSNAVSAFNTALGRT